MSLLSLIPGGFAAKAGAVLIVAAGIFTAGATAGYRWEEGRYEHLVASQAKAQVTALEAARADQERLDRIANAASTLEASRQAALASGLQRQLTEVRKHVQVVNRCVPYGFVRVLDAAAGGRITDSLSLPAGKSDASCAPVSWPTLAGAIIGNYGTALSNAEQLDALIEFWRKAR